MTVKQFALEIGVECTEVQKTLQAMGVFQFPSGEFPLGYQLSVAKIIIQKRDQALTAWRDRDSIGKPWLNEY